MPLGGIIFRVAVLHNILPTFTHFEPNLLLEKDRRFTNRVIESVVNSAGHISILDAPLMSFYPPVDLIVDESTTFPKSRFRSIFRFPTIL
jgi:hypothetical protein